MRFETQLFWLLLLIVVFAFSGLVLATIVSARIWARTSVKTMLDTRMDALRDAVTGEATVPAREPRSGAMEKIWLQHRLSTRLQHETVLNQRRVEAAERVWTKTSIGLRAVASLAASASIISFKATASRISRDESLRDYLDTIVGAVQERDVANGEIEAERLYVDELVWAFFSAYQTALHYAYLQLKIITVGIREAQNSVKIDALVDMMKTALPHQADLLERNPEGVFLLVNELRENVFTSIRTMLRGKDLEPDEVARASKMLSAVRRAQEEAERAKAVALKTW